MEGEQEPSNKLEEINAPEQLNGAKVVNIEEEVVVKGIEEKEEPQPGTSTSSAATEGTEEITPPEGPPNSRLFTLEHPMLNPMLLMKVISFYQPDIEDFKILRQVCKLWYNVTFEQWRKQYILRLTEEKEVFREQKGGGISVGEFLRRFEDPDDPYQLAVHPYTKYTFVEVTIDMSICDTPGALCKRFWDNIGPLMTYLHFNRCFFLSGQYMAFEQLILEKVPNLSTLCLTDTGKVAVPSTPHHSLYASSPFLQRQQTLDRVRLMKEKLLDDHLHLRTLQIYGGIPLKLRKLIAKLPYLDSLSIRNSLHSSAAYDDSIMDLLIYLRKQRISSNHLKYPLKHLDLMHTRAFHSWFSISRVLQNVSFPLETLSLEIKPDQSLNHQALKPLLEHHSRTLKTLKVFCPPLSNTNYHDTFPFEITLDSLEEVQFWGNVVRSFRCLKFFPNLKRLIVNRYCIEKWEEVILQQKEVSHMGWFHPNYRTFIQPFSDDPVQRAQGEGEDMGVVECTQLEEIRIDYEFGEQSLRRLADWAPNLTTLWTIVNKRNLKWIADLWPGLRNLIALFGSEVDDEAICTDLRRLQDLRRFQYDALCGQSKVTDKALDSGLLTMGRLDAVQICVGARFSKEGVARLKGRIPLVRVLRNYGRKPHGDPEAVGGGQVGVCCFHKKFFETIRSDEEEVNRQRAEREGAGVGVGGRVGARRNLVPGVRRQHAMMARRGFMRPVPGPPALGEDEDSSSSSESEGDEEEEDQEERFAVEARREEPARRRNAIRMRLARF